MLIQTTIQNQIRNTKLFAKDLLITMLQLEEFGENINADKIRFIVLHRLLETLERYYAANWDVNSVPISDPVDTCIDKTYFDKLMIKIKTVTDNKSYTVQDFVIQNGVWSDSGYWRDSTGIWADF